MSSTKKPENIDVLFSKRFKKVQNKTLGKKLMKRFITPFILLVLVIFIFLGGFFWWNKNSSPVVKNEDYRPFVIPKGYSATQIAQKLEDEGLIKSPFAFKVYVQATGRAKEVQAGRYSLSPNLSLTEIVSLLIKGPKDVWVTIPEGLRREEIVERFIEALGKEEQDEIIFRQEFMTQSEQQEGFLFPDTYLFPRDVKAETVVSYLRNTFDKRMKEFESGISESDLTLSEIVTLASIIERETKTDEERPVVAGILLNRLEIGMALQVDASVQYALANASCQSINEKCTNWWPILTKEDLKIDSPYNSYKYKGLAPAPISNPGLSSLKAAVFPQETNYLYYIHDAQGNIHYAETLQGHNENIRKYLGK